MQPMTKEGTTDGRPQEGPRLAILLGVLILLLSAVTVWRIVAWPRLADTFLVQSASGTWRTFEEPTGQFIVDFPGVPEIVNASTTIDGAAVPAAFYQVILTDGTSYSLQVVTYPASVDLSDRRLSLGRMIKAVLAAVPGNEFEQSTPLTFPGGGDGVDFQVKNTKTNDQLRLRFIIVGQQALSMSAAGPPGTTPVSDVFFDSLTLLPPPAAT